MASADKTTDKDKEDKKVMDVQKPGSTAADAGSRPVIIRHKGSFQDPMVKEDSEEETYKAAKDDKEIQKEPKEVKDSSQGEAVPVKTTGKTIVAPIADDKPDDSGSSDEPAESTPEKSEDSKTATASESNTSSDSAAVDALAEQAGSKKQNNKISEEEQKKREAVQKLIEEKKYFVPISKAHKKNHLFWAVSILLIAIAAGGYMFFYNDMSFTAPDETASQDIQTSPAVPAESAADKAKIAQDQERRKDMKMISSSLEGYFEERNRYPSLEELNDKQFRTQNHADLSDEIITDPEGDKAEFAAAPAAKVYAYTVTDAEGKQCDNKTSVCFTYVLTATLSDGELLEIKIRD